MIDTFDRLKKAYSDAKKELFVSVIITEQISDAEALASQHLMQAVKLLAAFLNLQSGKPEVQAQDFEPVRETVYPDLVRILGKDKADFCVSVLKESKSETVKVASLIKVQKYLDTVLNTVYSEVKKQNGKTLCACIKRHKKYSLIIAAVALIIVMVSLGFGFIIQQEKEGFKIVSARQDWGDMTTDMSLDSRELRIDGVLYKRGYATHANSEIEIRFVPKYKFFSGLCGMQDFNPPNPYASARCKIMSGDRVLFVTDVLRQRDPAVAFIIPVDDLTELTLITDDASDGNSGDHVNWVNLKLE